MTKKPIFWSAVTLASALCFFFSWQFFAKAFPILDVDISMSRESALETATERAIVLGLAPADARKAVRFNNDSEAQNFVELEAGGKEAFRALLNNDVYQTLRWEVRFFREKDAATTTLYFTPQGKPYGFFRYVPEGDPGAALTADNARAIAETVALRDWGIDLALGKSPYTLAEKSFDKRLGGRIDHVFTYEREDQRLGKNGEGRVQLKLVIAGDKLTEFQYFVKVPESFKRRFAEIRSANSTIAFAASLAMGVLYVFCGCVVGLMLLHRERFVISRPAVIWAGLIALLQAGAVLDRIPSAWFDYDTAISANAFIFSQIGMAAAAFFGMWLLLGVSFMAAESLSRKAFGHHPQLWRLWNKDAASSPEMLGRTVGGYLWVGFDLAFIVAFYYLTQHYLHWWSPLESLIDPNILATPMPWLGPVANSLQAGFWEECLFRAVPLAGAALIGDYLGRRFNGRFGARNTWLIIGLVVQALIFGAAHAGYAQQPSYARPVELFIPALIWGLVYLRFGLLPGIVFHFVFDLLLMSLPIFVTSASGLAFDRAMVIVCGLFPLLVVFWARWRAGRWHTLAAEFLNAAWTPTKQEQIVEDIQPISAQQVEMRLLRSRIAFPLLGVVGLVAWFVFAPFKQDAPPLYLDRTQAESAADAVLKERGVKLSAEWQRFSQVMQDQGNSHIFVWREGGPAEYAKLIGGYLAPPAWRVRYVRFSGDVADRAEEWIVTVENGVDGKGGKQSVPHIRLIDHVIPEAHSGKSLTVEDARAITHRAIRERFARDPALLREVSAVEAKRPNRRDWRFTFADDKNYLLKKGEARLEVYVAGDEVSYMGRYIHVPEEWERMERERRSLMKNVQIGVTILLALLVIGGIIFGIIRSTQGALSWRHFIGVTVIASVMNFLSRANGWQDFAMGLSTQQPLVTQLWILGASLVFGSLLMSLFLGLFAGLGIGAAAEGKLGHSRFTALLLPGVCLAGLLLGLSAVLNRFSTQELPRWENLSLLNQVYPALGSAINGAMGVLTTITMMTFLLVLLRDFNANFSKRRASTVLILFLSGFVLAMGAEDLSSFLMQGAGKGSMIALLYIFVARFEPKLVLIAAMAVSIFGQISTAVIAPYPHAALYAGFYIIALCATGVWWMRLLDGAGKVQA